MDGKLPALGKDICYSASKADNDKGDILCHGRFPGIIESQKPPLLVENGMDCHCEVRMNAGSGDMFFQHVFLGNGLDILQSNS
jgi:hypothetical protein